MADLEKYSTIPATRRTLNKLLAENRLLRMAQEIPNFVTFTNNSGGNAAQAGAISNIRTKFTHVTGNDLAQKAAFDTAAGTANNAIAVMKGLLTQIADPISIGELAGGNGTVATPGTVPAVTKAITGVDGASANALSRGGANAVFENIRNNLSTVVLAHNRLADALGGVRIMDNVGGYAVSSLTLANLASSGDAVDNTGDAASKAAVDATMTQVANNVDKIAKAIKALLDVVTANAFAFPEPEA